MKQNMINTDLIKIESGVAKSKVKNGGMPNKWFLIFAKMKIDDSFAIPFSDLEMARKIQGAVTGAKRGYVARNDPNFRCSTQILFIKKEVRIWRDA